MKHILRKVLTAISTGKWTSLVKIDAIFEVTPIATNENASFRSPRKFSLRGKWPLASKLKYFREKKFILQFRLYKNADRWSSCCWILIKMKNVFDSHTIWMIYLLGAFLKNYSEPSFLLRGFPQWVDCWLYCEKPVWVLSQVYYEKGVWVLSHRTLAQS